MKCLMTLAAMLTLLLSATLLAAETSARAAKPNVIFVLVDDLGYADTGAYGCTDIRTPSIDRLASEGIRFTDFYSNAPVCTPTRCGFITGRWQQRTGLEWALGFSAEQVVRQPAITMDLTATIAAACGASASAEAPFDGIDLLPILRGEKEPVERTFYWRVGRTDRNQKAIRHGNWKYVYDGALPMLFNLANDVGERQDLGYRHPEILKDLERRLAEWEADLAKNPPPMLVH